MALNTIQYTGEQARSFAGVSPEAWRHWRKVIPRLSAKAGKRGRFTSGELVALAVVASAVSTLGVGITVLASQWNDLFRLCALQRSDILRAAFVVVTEENVGLVDADRLAFALPAIVVPCAPIIDRLCEAAFFGEVEQTQVPLPFAPRAVNGSKR